MDVTYATDPAGTEIAMHHQTTYMMMKTQSKAKLEEGGTPTHGGPKGSVKQKDDSLKPAKVLRKESIAKSEKNNMTGKKGYNETPPTVPVKSTK